LAHNRIQTLSIAAHSVYSVTFAGLTLSPGVRAEIIRSKYTEHLVRDAGVTASFDPNVILFALGLRYAVTGNLALVGGVQQGMTPVAPSLGPVGPNGKRVTTPAKGQVERALNYEGGLRYTTSEWSASAIGFASHYSNVVSPCDENCSSGAASSTSFSSGRALVYGAELAGHGRARLAGAYGLPLHAAYTYTHAAFLQDFHTSNPVWAGPDQRVRAGDRMPYIPAHQFSLGAGVDYQQKLGLDVVLNFMDRMRETAGQGALRKGDTTDRYALLDAAAYYQLLTSVRVYLKADNVTNAQPLVSRRPFGARPNQPLLVQVGVKLEL
jgi:Fe(3+) dicitrate transport protein